MCLYLWSCRSSWARELICPHGKSMKPLKTTRTLGSRHSCCPSCDRSMSRRRSVVKHYTYRQGLWSNTTRTDKVRGQTIHVQTRSVVKQYTYRQGPWSNTTRTDKVRSQTLHEQTRSVVKHYTYRQGPWSNTTRTDKVRAQTLHVQTRSVVKHYTYRQGLW